MRFACEFPGGPSNAELKLNGETLAGAAQPGTYAKVSRRWKAGDVIELDFPMPVRLMEANPKIENLRNKVAVMRGPLVYCLELPKQEGGEKIWHERRVSAGEHRADSRAPQDLLGGVTILKGKALTHQRTRRIRQEHGRYRSTGHASRMERPALPAIHAPMPSSSTVDGTVEISLIPYYAWANRGLSMMEVWIPLAR